MNTVKETKTEITLFIKEMLRHELPSYSDEQPPHITAYDTVWFERDGHKYKVVVSLRR